MTASQKDRQETKIDRDTVVTGAEFRDFYYNHFPEGWYVEEMPYEAEDAEGNWVLPDDARRPLHWFGCAAPEGAWAPGDGMICISELYARTMGGRREDQVVSLRCPADKVDELKALAAELGAEVI